MAETALLATVVLVKLVVLTLAVILTHLTFSSYRRSGRSEIRALTAGFGAIAGGIVLGGTVFLVAGADVLLGVLFETVFLAVGLGMIIYSLYGFE